jgi:hypothetical protein
VYPGEYPEESVVKPERPAQVGKNRSGDRYRFNSFPLTLSLLWSFAEHLPKPSGVSNKEEAKLGTA